MNLRPFFTLFFLSGFTSLVYEVVFYKLLGYVFGGTTLAVTTVLVAFMGGLALGGKVIGAAADRIKNPILAYGLLELLIGAYVLLVPSILQLCERIYINVGMTADIRSPAHTAVRFGLSVAVLLLPTVLMGGTLPLLARVMVSGAGSASRGLSSLYAANTLGAASGTLAANYFLIRFLGIYGALLLGALANVAIFLRARQLHAQISQVPPSGERGSGEHVTRTEGSIPWGFAAATVFVTGTISFIYEVVWTHLLATIVGTSVYAFGLMLGMFLLGIGVGSLSVSRGLMTSLPASQAVARLQIVLGALVVLTLPLWDKLPYVFMASGALYPGFYLMEFIRALVCAFFLLGPCFCIGATFPLLLRSCADRPGHLGGRIGTMYALNTVGCILGAVAAGFWLIEAFGSQRVLAVSGLASAVIGLAHLVGSVGWNQAVSKRALAAVAVCCLCAVGFPQWNLMTLASGMNVYFDTGAKADGLVFSAEDTQGGFTTISRNNEGITLRTNGKFQGNDYDEVAAQYSFALIPLLLAKRFDSAFVIGYGTGATAGVLTRFPFKKIDVAEFSKGIVAADPFFKHVNFAALENPRVNLIMNDGRNHLLVTKKQYDLITIELTSIWFSGAANLYNREFYEICHRRLQQDGVLQQWVQLHHIDRLDLLVIWNTIKQVFPHVSLWVRGGQGLLVATNVPQTVDYRHVAAMNALPEAAAVKEKLQIPDFFWLLGSLALDEKALDSGLAQLRGWVGSRVMQFMVSTDLMPYLEYATPSGNALRWARDSNLRWIESLDRRLLPTIEGIPDLKAARRVTILAAHGHGKCERALRLLDEHGPDAQDDNVLRMIQADCAARVAATAY